MRPKARFFFYKNLLKPVVVFFYFRCLVIVLLIVTWLYVTYKLSQLIKEKNWYSLWKRNL